MIYVTETIIERTYRALFKSANGKQLAIDTFRTHRRFYHPICAQMVAKDILGE